ncbi:MAG TPA: CRTAC1 family protein [Blastocatellia bacterium]|nr:CRTAC1 family protein [Blastocatellia bacterium]
MRRIFLLAVALACLISLDFVPESDARAGANSSVRFVDATQVAAIRFKHVSAPEKKYIVESMSGGVALFDYDNDGWLDIYFTNSLTVDTANNPKSSPSALYHNNGDGTFTDVTEKSGLAFPGWAMGVAAADYDADGWTDLYVTCFGSNHLYRNNGNGTFTDVTEQAGVDDLRWSAGAAFGDYDNDGDLDLFITNYVDFRMKDLPEFGKGKFCQYRGIPVQCGPRGLPGAGDALFRNNGNGTFTDVSKQAGVSDPNGRYGMSALWSDLDADGWLDLYVSNDSGPNFLYKNNRDGTFKEVGLLSGCAVGEDGNEQGSMGLTIADYNHDGLLDIFVTNFSDEYNTLYRQEQGMSFMDVSFASKLAQVSFPYVGWATEFFDYDNDGWVDLMVVNGHVYPQVDNVSAGSTYAQRILLFHNERNGTFSEVAASSGDALMARRVSRGAAFGDIDNDGDTDVVINNLDGSPLVLRNDGGNANNWITIKTIGSKKNRDALGAYVKVMAGNLSQVNEVRSGGSYISQNDTRLHFGLGDRARVDSIEVRWPGGKTELIRDVAANQFITIEEGKGITKKQPPAKAVAKKE